MTTHQSSSPTSLSYINDSNRAAITATSIECMTQYFADDAVSTNAYYTNLPKPLFYTEDNSSTPNVCLHIRQIVKEIIELSFSLHLSTDMYYDFNDTDDDDVQMKTAAANTEDDVTTINDRNDTPESLPKSLRCVCQKIVKISKLYTTLSSTYKLHCLPNSTLQTQIILHLLQLLTATVCYGSDGADGSTITIQYENVGCILDVRNSSVENVVFGCRYYGSSSSDDSRNGDNSEKDMGDERQALHAYLAMHSSTSTTYFALPIPTRELLLILLSNLVQENTYVHTTMSSLSIVNFVSAATMSTCDEQKKDEESSIVLILHWKVLLQYLLRIAPYLDEKLCMDIAHITSAKKVTSTVHVSAELRRTIVLLKCCSDYYDQYNYTSRTGATINNSVIQDTSANCIWNMLKHEILYSTHTIGHYRGAILLFLLMPKQCSAHFYETVLPDWCIAWNNHANQKCYDYECIWIQLFHKVRQYTNATIATTVRLRIFTSLQHWLQIPIGGNVKGSSFPSVGAVSIASCPNGTLKSFLGSSSSYSEGMYFIAKITSLLVAGLGTESASDDENSSNMYDDKETSASNTIRTISSGTKDVLRFFAYITPYFNPSNFGGWSYSVAVFLHYFAHALAVRLGSTAGCEALLQQLKCDDNDHLDLDRSNIIPSGACQRTAIPAHEVIALLHTLLPLCQQVLYSKNGTVSRAGESAMECLIQIDPERTSPAFMDFACQALDISAVNLAHQAPVALSALNCMIQPSLRSDPAIVLSRLPILLRQSLAGIDGNDQNKSIRTLILYRTILSWIPVGCKPLLKHSCSSAPESESTRMGNVSDNGTCTVGYDLYKQSKSFRSTKEYKDALKELPSTSLLRQGIHEDGDNYNSHHMEAIVDEVAITMSEWSLSFLQRVFEMLGSSGEREKRTKSASRAAQRQSSADLSNAKNVSRVLRETLIQLFVGMDNETHRLALTAVHRFLDEETLMYADKDASIVCEAAATIQCRDEPAKGLNVLVPILTDDLKHNSIKTATYRIRCLAGCAKSSGSGLLQHRDSFAVAIRFALSSEDRHLFKAGCKLLRHTLATLCESYPISTNLVPAPSVDESGVYSFGQPAELSMRDIHWHVPNCESIKFAIELISQHAMKRLEMFCSNSKTDPTCPRSVLLDDPDIDSLRRSLRIMRYTIRGGSGILLDNDDNTIIIDSSKNETDDVPYETAMKSIISQLNDSSILNVRSVFCKFVVILATIIASDSLYPEGVTDLDDDSKYKKSLSKIGHDRKICKETLELSQMLLLRRGAAFRSIEAAKVYSAHVQMTNNTMLAAQFDYRTEVLGRAGRLTSRWYLALQDGEDAGDSLPWRLLTVKLKLFHDALQRSASFEVPKRLRGNGWKSENRIFNVMSSLTEMLSSLESSISSTHISVISPLDAYDGIFDGLFAMSCHGNTIVKSSAVSIIDYSVQRYEWLVSVRVDRLLDALSMKDGGQNGNYGIPSCAELVASINPQGKRKKLAEVAKGICSILSLSRVMKHVLRSHRIRAKFTRTLLETHHLLDLIPGEDAQKMVHYLHVVFKPFRTKLYRLSISTRVDFLEYACLVEEAISVLSVNATEDNQTEKIDVYWRKRLLACWVLIKLLEPQVMSDTNIMSKYWSICISLLESEKGQPLQRVALGLLGKLLSMSQLASHDSVFSIREKMASKSFCSVIVDALVYDHREDTSVGGGHTAQWAIGIEDFIRDSSRHIATRTLFPFQNNFLTSSSFKSSHCTLMNQILTALEVGEAVVTMRYLLSIAKELSVSPPSEDQRNQVVTSAEVFAGLCKYTAGVDFSNSNLSLDSDLLLYLEEVITSVPLSSIGPYFDAIRFTLQCAPPRPIYVFTEWFVSKLVALLWKPSSDSNSGSAPSIMSEGFSTQSKLMYLFSAVLTEMNGGARALLGPRWYESGILNESETTVKVVMTSTCTCHIRKSWTLVVEKLLPQLIDALGHPYNSCRDHVARCLYRISCNFQTSYVSTSLPTEDPESLIVSAIISLDQSTEISFTQRCNSLQTIRFFISRFLHHGEDRHSYSKYVLPLLPLVFKAVGSTLDDNSVEDDTTKRNLEAELMKGYRGMIADISASGIVSYERPEDIDKVLECIETARNKDKWQIREAVAHFLRCFQGVHQFVFTNDDSVRSMKIAANLLGDERQEVSMAAMSALTGILVASSETDVTVMVNMYIPMAYKSRQLKPKKKPRQANSNIKDSVSIAPDAAKELERSQQQKISVFFLCSVVLCHPYDTPIYVPRALEAISKHSFERNAPLGIRDTVKRCCAEYKKTHMSDNWARHRSVFTQDQLEALEDVVSAPHYYA